MIYLDTKLYISVRNKLKTRSRAIFKRLKDVFIEEEEGDKKVAKDSVAQKDTPVEPEAPIATNDVHVEAPKTSSSETSSGKPDPKFVDILLKAIEKNNQEGFDYLEYKSSLQSLAKMDMDEATRYQSALAMAKTMGATPESLIDSANRYLSILKAESMKFQEALKGQKAKNVTGREAEIKSINADIEKKKQLIAQLQKEIETSTKQQEQLKAKINASTTKVQETSDNFNAALNAVGGQIQNDVAKMKQYLK